MTIKNYDLSDVCHSSRNGILLQYGPEVFGIKTKIKLSILSDLRIRRKLENSNFKLLPHVLASQVLGDKIKTLQKMF